MADIIALVIDDEKNARQQMCNALKKEGFMVIEADDGAKGFEYFISIPEQIYLVVIEVKMRKSDGWKTCREIRNVSNVPVVLVSKYDEGDSVKAYDCGADQFIVKPFSQEVFLASVKAVLRRIRCS